MRLSILVGLVLAVTIALTGCSLLGTKKAPKNIDELSTMFPQKDKGQEALKKLEEERRRGK